MPGAVEVVRGFRTLHVLVIGDVMLDSYLEGSAARLCSEGPVPVIRKTAEERAPGGAGNVAANLVALGAEVSLLGVVGHDLAGDLLRQALRERGVDDSCLVQDDALATVHKLRILADDQYVVRFDEGDSRDCAAHVRQRLQDELRCLYPRCDLVVISDYGYGVASDQILAELRRLRALRPCVLVVDSKQLRRFHSAGATMLTPNHLEARLTVDPTAHLDGEPSPAEMERIGRQLLAMIDAEQVAITMAARGVLLVDRQGGTRHLAAHPVARAREVGAGDSFTAAAALALAAGASAAQAVSIGIDAAAIAVSRRHTAVVRHQELLQKVSLVEGVTSPPAHELAWRLADERRQGRTVVFTNGVFDILHAGHVHFLRQARSLGDVLVVGVNSDASARRLKGKNRPITSERDRLALVAALDSVDHAVLFDEETPIDLIRTLQPDLHVKGGDYADQELPEAEAVREVGGRVVVLPLVGQLSTTSVIDRILAVSLER